MLLICIIDFLLQLEYRPEATKVYSAEKKQKVW